MNLKPANLLVAAVMLLLVPLSLNAGKIPAAEAKKHIGEYAQVCGKVASTRHATAGNHRGETVLDLDKPHPNQVFTVVIWDTERSKFDKPEEHFRDKEICVTGRVETHRGAPQMVVTDANQIKEK